MDKLIPYDNKQLQKVGNAIAVTNKLLALVEPQLIPYCKGDKWGFCTADKNIVIDCVYEDATEFSEGLASVKLDGKYGFIDKKNKTIIPFKYQSGGYFNDNLCSIHLKDKIGFIDKSDNVIIPFIYDDLSSDFSKEEGLVSIKIDNKWGFIDKQNNIIIPFEFDLAFGFYNDVAVVEKFGKYGTIGRNGKVIIPIIYNRPDWDLWTK